MGGFIILHRPSVNYIFNSLALCKVFTNDFGNNFGLKEFMSKQKYKEKFAKVGSWLQNI